MASVYTVGQVNYYIKNMFRQDFALNKIYIKGEVSNCKYHTSGHIYFTLKDSTGVISAVMFAGDRSGLKFKMEEGQNVVALGSVSVYERDGKYQLYAKQIILEGAGLLYQRFEQLKQELEEIGLFDAMYKKPIPKFATKIGICTAKTGAAIQDIIHISSRRNPFVQLYLYPCLVQGAEAAKDIVNAIRCLDEMELDVLIVGRGGGSIEDLWAFNEEIVAKAIFDCRTPVISAVGHETDTTIADFVADMRAPTPSAAAELAVFDYSDFVDRQTTFVQMLKTNMRGQIQACRNRALQYETMMQFYSPENQLQSKKQYVQDLAVKLSDSFCRILNERRHLLEIYAEKLNGLSPLNKITKGYSYVTDQSGKPLHSVRQLKIGDEISMVAGDGKVLAGVKKIEKVGRGKGHGERKETVN